MYNSASQLVKTSLLSTSLLQFCKRTSLLQLVNNLLQSCQANILSNQQDVRFYLYFASLTRFETSRVSTDSNRSVADGHQLVPSFLQQLKANLFEQIGTALLTPSDLLQAVITDLLFSVFNRIEQGRLISLLQACKRQYATGLFQQVCYSLTK